MASEQGPLSREERVEEFGERKVEHTEWWDQESDRAQETMDALVDVVELRDECQLVKRGTSVSRDGEHTISLTVNVAGEPWVPTHEGEERTVYLCGGCERIYEEPAGDHTKRCPRCGTEVAYDGTEVRTVVF